MNIRIRTRVVKLEEREKVISGKKDEKDVATLTFQKLGWFLHLEGSYEALFVGNEKPDGFAPGTEIDIIISPRGK